MPATYRPVYLRQVIRRRSSTGRILKVELQNVWKKWGTLLSLSLAILVLIQFLLIYQITMKSQKQSTGAVWANQASQIRFGKMQKTLRLLPNESQSVPLSSDGGTVVYRETLSAGWPPEIQQWKLLIEKWADQYWIDPDLIAAVMLMESGGNPNPVSRSGACGLMQVMASDTSTVRPELFRNRPTCGELKDPETNVGWAVHYLAMLYHRWGDNWREALYHYGPIDVGHSYADRVLNLYQASK